MASTQAASSIDSAPCHCTAGVGQMFSKVTDASSSTSAAKGEIHRITGLRESWMMADRVWLWRDAAAWRRSQSVSARNEYESAASDVAASHSLTGGVIAGTTVRI